MFFEDLQPPVNIKIHVCSETRVLLQEFKAPCKTQITEGPRHQPLKSGKPRKKTKVHHATHLHDIGP